MIFIFRFGLIAKFVRILHRAMTLWSVGVLRGGGFGDLCLKIVLLEDRGSCGDESYRIFLWFCSCLGPKLTECYCKLVSYL
jgi:hypothetical protein